MPGRFPGRVVEVRHPDAVNDQNVIRRGPVAEMIARGMTGLTGADHPIEAWRSLFERGDVVGVKVNPVGVQSRPDAVGAVSSPAVILEVVEGLKSAGVRPRDIVLFERYAHQFREAGYDALMNERSLAGVRWLASGSAYDAQQLSIDGFGTGRDRQNDDPHVVGYDPDVFVHLGFADPEADSKDDRRFRSHLSVIVTRMVNKIVTIPVLKDHRSAGVTLSLKNLSHGLNNNVARSHIPTLNRRGGGPSCPNQCNTFIPTAAGQDIIRRKATLHVLDGLIGVYEGGPGCWNPTWATWRRKSLFFATDPVALDLVGWRIIDEQRARYGWDPVQKMGLVSQSRALAAEARVSGLAAAGALDALSLAACGPNYPGSQETEAFDRRQPEHILLAGTIGLGVYDPDRIDHRCTTLLA